MRNLHVKGSTSQPSRVAEEEQTMKIRKYHRELSRKSLLYIEGLGRKKLHSNQPESIFLTKEIQLNFIGKGINGHPGSSNPSCKREEVTNFCSVLSIIREGPRETERGRERTQQIIYH